MGKEIEKRKNTQNRNNTNRLLQVISNRYRFHQMIGTMASSPGKFHRIRHWQKRQSEEKKNKKKKETKN